MRLSNALRIYVIIVFELMAKHSFAQQQSFRNINHNAGLPYAQIHKCEEDSVGYIWMATNKGIFRHDGQTYKFYDASRESGESQFFFVSRKPGSNTLFFISNTFKLIIYQDGRFIPLDTTKKICWGTNGADGSVYFLTRKGDILLYKGGKLLPLPLPAGASNIYYHLLSLKGGGFLLSNEIAIEYIPVSGKRITLLKQNDWSFKHIVPRLFKAGPSRILATTAEGIYEFDTNYIRLRLVFPIKNNVIFTAYKHPVQQDIWIGASKGVIKFKDGILDKSHAYYYLQNETVLDIVGTSEQVFIFSSLHHGLFMSTFQSAYYGKHEGIDKGEIHFLCGLGDNLYAVSENAYIFRLNGNHFSTLSESFSTRPSRFKLVYRDKNSLLLFPALNYDSFMYRVNKNSIIRIPDENSRYNPVLAYHQDTLKLMYNLGEVGEIASWVKPRFVEFISHAAERNPMGNLLLLISQNRKTLYYASPKGYLTTDIHNWERKTTFTNLGSQVTWMMQLDSATLVACTWNKGLVFIKNNKQTWLNKENGLSGNRCYKMIRDGHMLWVMTDQGLSRIQLSSGKNIISISNFNENNVFRSLILYDFTIWKEDVYVAEYGGVCKFSKHLRLPDYKANIHIDRFRINNRDTIIQGAYRLPYHYNNISISASTASLLYAGKTQFRYLLLKNEDTLVNRFGQEETLELFSLAPGRYNLWVSTMSAAGVWNIHPENICIEILPVFWRSWWFMMSTGAIGVLLTFLLVQKRMQVNKREMQLQNKLIESELRSLHQHMNPHFIFNSLNALQAIVLKNNPLQANEYIASFSQLIRWGMLYSRRRELNLQEELSFLKLYVELEQLRFKNRFQVNFMVEDGLNVYQTYIPSLLLLPFVENAIKYGMTEKKPGIIDIRFTAEAEFLKVSICDNGPGRKQIREEQEMSKREHNGTGIAYTEERLKLLIKKKGVKPVIITDLYEQGKASGTLIELTIPICI